MFKDDGAISKAMTAAIVALLGWNVMTTQTLSINMAVMSSAIVTLKETLYTESDARAANILVDNRIQTLETWAQNLSERMRLLERDFRATSNEK